MASDPAIENARARSGFTLIEMLASVVVLLLIVLAMGRLYASATKAYQETMKQAERDAGARAVMDFLSREISLAMFDNGNLNTNALLTMRYRANTAPENFGLEGADEIWLLSANNNLRSDRPREAVMRVYFVGNYMGLTDAPSNARYRFALWQNFAYPSTPDTHPYAGGTAGLDWPESGALNRSRMYPLLENVRTFEIFAYADADGTRVYEWDSRDPQPLFCMDIYLETLSEADAIRAAQLAATLGHDNIRTIEFVEGVVRRHYQRIYFPHKFSYFDQGYP
ncbi:MAG TPA: prepilin-type N-terminal cleavage/methylation domain-containing protein [Kiritimatiellia bacterium]|nr:prepilin-type N-terminal cleavage/methylation domain-containing protein [Kiritimatiellia bacterium]